jgi:hypothetical protein
MAITIALLIFPTVTPIANYSIYKFGFAANMRIAAILNLVGGWIKMGTLNFLKIIYI